MSELDNYIAANRDRYTREAITDQLLAAGHSRAAIDAAWERASGAGVPQRSWRPGWRTFVLLILGGGVGAALVWAGESYGGNVIAPVVYVILASVAFGLAKGLAIVAERGAAIPVGVVLAMGVAAAAYVSFSTGLQLLALAIVVLGGIPAVLLVIRSSDSRVTGMVATAVPLLAWLAVTGTCYAPLYGRLMP